MTAGPIITRTGRVITEAEIEALAAEAEHGYPLTIARGRLIHIGFTGTRWGLAEPQYSALARYLDKVAVNYKQVYVHHGMCIGADAELNVMARSRGLETIGHPPLDTSKMAKDLELTEIRPPKEFTARNKDIVEGSIYLIACPRSLSEQWRGSGTWQAIRYAEQRRRPVLFIWRDGIITTERRR